MEPHDADILGHTDSLVPPLPAQKSVLASTSQAAVILLATWIVYAFGKRLWARVLRWKENTHKLAMRRRHGIPDNDLRPFNVAYADAMSKAREGEHPNSSRASLRPQPHVLDRSDFQPHSNLRQRSDPQQPLARYSTVPVPGSFASHHSPVPSSHRLESSLEPRNVDRYSEANFSYADHAPWPSGPLSNLLYDDDSRQMDQERASEDGVDRKDASIQSDDWPNGDEYAETQDEPNVSTRGSKRGHGEDDDLSTATKKARGKRARKVSLEQPWAIDEDMEVDNEDELMDEVPEMRSPNIRGKKRDREEAASTFGGDDESDAEPEDSAVLRRRQRKRRTVAKRQSEASYLRGKKRDREGNENLSDEEVLELSPVMKKKRGKRPALVDQNQDGDFSMDESTTSRSSKTRRSIGDEWESNGIRWKIGPNGQRLRQALVKKARQKFSMPKDSQHPDRNANLQVCVECWLTEHEYQDAKSKHMLAWQDSPMKDERDLSIDTESVPFPSSVLGKSLLWSASAASSPSGSPASSVTHDLPAATRTRSYARHSIATTVGIPFNPFMDSSAQSVRRIASSSRATSLKSKASVTPVEAVNGSTPKTFSKWEKQELEANAMMKIRNANKKKEEERDAKLKAEQEKAAREKMERERQERERQERERAERLAKEKAEAEKKANEVVVPKITVTAPSSENITQPSPVASNLFGPKPSTTGPASSTFVSTAPGSTTPNIFSNPAQPTTVAPSNEAPKPTFSLGFPPSSAPKESTSVATQPPAFAFAPPATQPEKKEEPKTSNPFSNATPQASSTTFGFGAPISTSNSLLNRVSPSNGSEPAKQGDASKSTPASQPQLPFQLGGTGSPSQSTPAATVNGTSSTTTGPKFTFGFPKPAASSSSAITASTAPSSTLSTALGTDSTKASPFTFKVPGAPASATAANPPPASTTTSTTPAGNPLVPKFTFETPANNASGTSGSTQPAVSVFGNTNTTSVFGGASTTPTSKPPTTTTGPFGTSTPASGSTSVFGGAGSTPTTSAFGTLSSTPTTTPSGKGPTFGSTSAPASNLFNSGGAGTGATSAFGTSTTPASSPWSASGTSSNTNATQNPFGVSNSKPAETTAKFSFGAQSTSGTTGNAITAPKFMFGATGGPSTATTTNGSTTSGPKAFAFGATPPTSNPSATESTLAKANPFGAPATPATSSDATSSTTPASTPAAGSGQGAFANPSEQSSLRSSPFGAPMPPGFSLFSDARHRTTPNPLSLPSGPSTLNKS